MTVTLTLTTEEADDVRRALRLAAEEISGRVCIVSRYDPQRARAEKRARTARIVARRIEAQL